jgi:hypothetical protein
MAEIVAGTPYLQELAMMTAEITAFLYLRAGLDTATIEASLRAIVSEFSDRLLDQERPGAVIPGG